MIEFLPMSDLDIPVVLFQAILPLILLFWLMLRPSACIFVFWLQAVATGLALLAIALVSIWSVPPWWVPVFYGLFWLAAVGYHILISRHRFSSLLPQTSKSWLTSAGFLMLGIYGGLLSTNALTGRFIDENEVVNLPLPMGSGTYLVVNGGASETINAHFLTLRPTTERQRAYRGQSFAVDIVKINKVGMRASGWRPRDPKSYEIFGELVYAPCNGQVVIAADGMPDMPVPQPDTTRLEGNHVFLSCGGYGVLLAHLQMGSLLVKEGDQVSTGLPIARVGNSGQTFEPHLHVHVQELAGEGFAFSGQPVHLMLNGIYPVRNKRLAGSMN